MFDKQINVHTTEAARVLAVGKCLIEARGKLLHLPARKQNEEGCAVWSGLITQLKGGIGYNNIAFTYVFSITGAVHETSLSLQETMKLLSSNDVPVEQGHSG